MCAEVQKGRNIMSNYIPFPQMAGDMPIDISFAFGDEEPAGKHGFLKVQGDKFVFEDGTPGRFWGVCLNASACFPPHDHAEALANRLAKSGVNLVRLHQMDREYAVPNVFQFQRGPRVTTTRKLNERSMERLDYLVKCLKDEGIYIILDLLTGRNFKMADGVENPNAGTNPYSMYDPKMIELQKEYIWQLLNHVNTYTGLAYKDDPVFVMSGINNEVTLFRNAKKPAEPYASMFLEMFDKWCKEKGIEKDVSTIQPFVNYDDPDLIRFKIEVETKYFKEMRDYMLSIGVKYPISGSNYVYHSGFFASNGGEMDYRDNHMYFHRFFDVSGTSWKEDMGHKVMPNFALTDKGDCGFIKLMQMRSLDKPFVVSEWNMTWPNEFRAESPILYAATCALQGTGAIAIHTYSYQNVQKDDALLGKETTATGLGGVPYREGIFCSWNDPAIYGLFYHSALILRRADVREAEKRIAVVTDPIRSREQADFVKEAKDPFDWYAKWKRYDRMAPCYYTLAEESKIGTCLADEIPEGVDKVYTEPEWGRDPAETEVTSDTGEMYRTWKNNYGKVDTDRTKCLYGFLRKNGRLEMKDLAVTCETDFATIAMSSLTDDALSKTDNILLTTVGRARNKNSEFYGDQLIKWGERPIEVEVIEATIELKTEVPNMKVSSIAPDGTIQGTIPSTYKDGVLTFTVGQQWRSMYYLIQQS